MRIMFKYIAIALLLSGSPQLFAQIPPPPPPPPGGNAWGYGHNNGNGGHHGNHWGAGDGGDNESSVSGGALPSSGAALIFGSAFAFAVFRLRSKWRLKSSSQK